MIQTTMEMLNKKMLIMNIKEIEKKMMIPNIMDAKIKKKLKIKFQLIKIMIEETLEITTIKMNIKMLKIFNMKQMKETKMQKIKKILIKMMKINLNE